ncbi:MULTISPECIES: hypothetical protein [unclassified Bradyrhizobium]|uniref:hypothetical protein n=1 Tax=unclassified Bradyrhizobium TaxID=2631580 RepID=UPI002915DD8D|nr:MULTISPECIES: hypothetical protein [unclassified Bradyrhizobium]
MNGRRAALRSCAVLLCAVLRPASSLAAEPFRAVDLVVPRPLDESKAPVVEISLGALGRGQEVTVTTASGMPLGTISPFGLRTGAEAGTYALPVPKEAIKSGRLSIRLSISQPGGSRAPTPQEVRGITLRLAPRP